MISKRNGDVVRDNRMLTMTLDCRRFVTRGTCICATDRKRYIQFAVFGTETFQSTVKRNLFKSVHLADGSFWYCWRILELALTNSWGRRGKINLCIYTDLTDLFTSPHYPTSTTLPIPFTFILCRASLCVFCFIFTQQCFFLFFSLLVFYTHKVNQGFTCYIWPVRKSVWARDVYKFTYPGIGVTCDISWYPILSPLLLFSPDLQIIFSSHIVFCTSKLDFVWYFPFTLSLKNYSHIRTYLRTTTNK